MKQVIVNLIMYLILGVNNNLFCQMIQGNLVKMITKEEVNSYLYKYNIKQFNYLHSKSGVYDNHCKLYKLSSHLFIFYSEVLQQGFLYNGFDTFTDIIKHATINNSFKEKILEFKHTGDYIYKNYSFLSKRINFEIRDDNFDNSYINNLSNSLSIFLNKRIKGKDIYIPLVMLIGEIIRRRVEGNWKIHFDLSFFYHVPQIVSESGKIYDPVSIVNKILYDKYTDLASLLSIYL